MESYKQQIESHIVSSAPEFIEHLKTRCQETSSSYKLMMDWALTLYSEMNEALFNNFLPTDMKCVSVTTEDLEPRATEKVETWALTTGLELMELNSDYLKAGFRIIETLINEVTHVVIRKVTGGASDRNTHLFQQTARRLYEVLKIDTPTLLMCYVPYTTECRPEIISSCPNCETIDEITEVKDVDVLRKCKKTKCGGKPLLFKHKRGDHSSFDYRSYHPLKKNGSAIAKALKAHLASQDYSTISLVVRDRRTGNIICHQ